MISRKELESTVFLPIDSILAGPGLDHRPSGFDHCLVLFDELPPGVSIDGVYPIPGQGAIGSNSVGFDHPASCPLDHQGVMIWMERDRGTTAPKWCSTASSSAGSSKLTSPTALLPSTTPHRGSRTERCTTGWAAPRGWCASGE